ncbi:MAG TPA: hypothetical protein VGB27_06505 [Candidatus Binatia bacterium]
MPSYWTIKASSRGVVVRGDGAIDAFTVGGAWKKRLLDLGKRFVKSEASPRIGGYTCSLSHRLI